MKYYSTRSNEIKAVFCDAIQSALAPDGGLYVPSEFPLLPEGNYSYPRLAAKVLSLYSGLEETAVLKETEENYKDFPIPLVKTESGHFLELFHGPSGAFKDVALTMLPRVATLCGQPKTTYITATSGDTGKAAMEALKDRKDAKIMVFYPKDGVGYLQEKQMVTQEGDNVRPVAINGNFDDAQRAVKEILAGGYPHVSSCNSINMTRVVSQIPYYFYAAQQWKKKEALVFFVPCGNFGNILAGWYAKQMGLPVEKLVVCTNENTVLRDFFETGVYDRRRDLVKTVAPSMDILVSSNLERLLYHLMGPEETALRMEQLAKEGVFQVPVEILSDFATYGADKEEVAAVTRTVMDEAGYVIDPHTAYARAAWETFGRPENAIILATASPSKFPESIMQMLSGKEYGSEEALERLYAITDKHPAMENIFSKPVRFTETIDPQQAMDVFTSFYKEQI